ncbi:MAG: aspartate aminotransferase family protein [Candidatus Anstonellales archaeon]
MISNLKNLELTEIANKLMPGGHSNLRTPVGVKPLFIVKGKGAHFWDVDGNEYIDFMIGAGPGIFGHGHEEYIQALKNQMDELYYLISGAAQTPKEIELAEKFVKYVPCAEKVRFCLSGTEAVQLAIRLSRAYTKRPYFIRFEGHYHGWLDNVLGGIVDDYAIEKLDKPFAIESEQDPLHTEGRFSGALKESFKLPWNDIDVFEKIIKKYGEEIALVLMEPINCNGGCCPPRPGYLEKVRELCTKYGIVLCFDEVITGFRVAINCAQGILGVTPDLSIFGKALAGGVPMGALAGKREIMDLLLERKVIGAGTFNGYPLGIAASLASLKILEKDNGAYYKKIDKLQNRLMSGLKEISQRYGIPALVQGPRGVFFYQFVDREIAYNVRDLKGADIEKQNKFRTLLAEKGILIMWGGRWYLSGAHTETDIDKALECVDKTLGLL